MAKFKKTLRDKQEPVVKSTKTSIVKKQRKKKDNEVPLSGIHKSNLKKLNTSNEVAKNTYTNIQSIKKKKKRDSKNNLDVKDTKRSDVQAKYPKDNRKTSEVSEKVQININKTERKKRKRSRKRKRDNLDHANKGPATIDGKERNKKLQMPATNLDIERRKTKIEKLKKVNEKKMKQISAEVGAQQVKPDKIVKLNKHKINIKQLEEMLTGKLQPKPKVTQLPLRDRMITQLRASRFRFINEILYSNDSSQSKHYFKTDPDAFMAYHAGYKQQLEQWAVNPLDVIISSIKKLSTDNVIADFGCGEARLAASVPHKVHSFDFIALNDRVKACDMAHTPLLMNSVHVVVFCLSLMGSNLNDYIIEANRILKNNGTLKIAEVESRFEDVKDFIRLLRSYGFKNTWKDLSHNLFYFMDFKKEEDISMKRKNLPPITLKSCLYKKR
ncbi:uncharacterized protein [Temnothorax longispinosus]|uniref:Ribosomal RNA-processing protein 8 n=1 Tax=Temnothorax longispinosus TaxID=300112 RepID=A0A4S2L464_9HYME|nr:Ribosomal RNA-processing protein 8 [Temnothorax longispinosus]